MNCFMMSIWMICSIAQPVQYTIDDLYYGIKTVEGWNESEPWGTHVIGPYQISYAYWIESNTPGLYIQCLDKKYSERVMMNNWKQDLPQALEKNDLETLARYHNGGPDGPHQTETIKYWKLVKQAMENKYAN